MPASPRRRLVSDHTFITKRGLQVRIRPLRPDDTEYLIEIFEHMSPESRYLRFHQPLIDPDPAFVRRRAQQIAQVACESGRAFLAFADLPGEPNVAVGGAQYVRAGPGVAEVALSVRDELQGQGIGSELLRLLTKQAKEEGIEKFVAVFQANNKAIQHVLRRVPLPVKREYHGSEVWIEVDLTTDTVWKQEMQPCL
ncbi:MAG: N-acetyltransferase [Caldilineae bacterium]|nr:MAG: N-acetyltransferase [Caldilineae bacterium]